MQVYISATLKSFFGRNSKLDIKADSVKGLLDLLIEEYPDSGKILFDENGDLRKFIRIYSGNEDITSSDRWNDRLPENAEILLLPAIAAGAPEESIIPEERRKETVGGLGGEDENYLFGLGFGKIILLVMRLLLKHFITFREEV